MILLSIFGKTDKGHATLPALKMNVLKENQNKLLDTTEHFMKNVHPQQEEDNFSHRIWPIQGKFHFADIC